MSDQSVATRVYVTQFHPLLEVPGVAFLPPTPASCKEPARKCPLVLHGKLAAIVGHLDQRTTQPYTHSMPKDKKETVASIPFEF